MQLMRRGLAEAINITDTQNPSPAHSAPGTEPTPRQLAQSIYSALYDAKGIDAVALDVSKNFGLADYFLVVSGRSDRHVQGLANKVLEKLLLMGVEPYSVQGLEQGHWVVIDLVDVVLHIFYEPLRERYDLESLWVDANAVKIPELRALKPEAVPV